MHCLIHYAFIFIKVILSTQTDTMIPIPKSRKDQNGAFGVPLSESFQDLCAVAPVLNCKVTEKYKSPLDDADLTKKPSIETRDNGRIARASELLATENQPKITAVQEGENDIAEIVIVCEPEGTSLQMGGLHPRASLYEKPVNLEAAKTAHAEFRRIMRDNNVRVLTVREILSYGTEEHVGARVELENFATQALTYRLADDFTVDDLDVDDRYYLSDEYKIKVLEHMSVPQLIDTILINPTVHLAPSYRDTGLTATYSFKPLSNLVYTRDQQITTAKGIVMGRLRSPQRNLEVSLMEFCFQKLGLPVIGAVQEPGYLEGGDFVPASADLAFVGVGLRSNVEACYQLMKEDLFGYKRVAIVRDDFEQHQDRMHLDCVFGLLSDTCCLMLEEMMGMHSPTRRLVDEYVREGPGTYIMKRKDVEFSQYLRDNGFNIIPVEPQHQLEYACNILNLGDQRIISVHPEAARKIVRSPFFTGDVQCIDYSPITSMYGAVHCSSQVVKRRTDRAAK